MFGLDYRRAPAQFEAADFARRTGHLILAGPLKLVQGGEALIARLPVYTYSISAKRQFWGLISALIDNQKMYQQSWFIQT